ncbi:ROK family transcriptional regulator [Paenibacillus sp. FSL R5-0407]|uniref:ROK family transcriptional regulator n=1 Tax=Paenibacillus sp. FSL R5-0407 TaxID=2975320 RepID=UPI0030F560DF
MNKIGNQQMLREINKALLLHLIHERGPVSRVELSRETKLSPSTVSILVDEVIREGLVHETGTSGSGVGRKMTMLEIKADSGYVVGIDLSNPRCVLLDMKGELKAVQKIPRLLGAEQIRDELAGTVMSFLEHHDIGLEQVRRIGISVPGRIDESKQTVIGAIPIGLDRLELGAIMEEALGAPVQLVNDIDAAGFAERYNGTAQGLSTILYILIDYGVGAGLVIDNHIYRGSSGRAGRTPELGQFSMIRYAESLKLQFPEHFAETATPEQTLQEFTRLGMSGTSPVSDELERLVNDIAADCNRMLNLMNPEAVILSGWIAEEDALFAKLAARIQELEHGVPEPTPVQAAHWKTNGAAVGAATLGLHEMFRMMMID